MAEACFDLKGSMAAFTVLDLSVYHPERFARQLAKTTAQAPKFFRQAPVIISLEKLDACDLPIDVLLSQCREFGLEPLAFRGGEDWRQAVEKTGLSLLSPNVETKKEEADPAPANVSTPAKRVTTSKIVTMPVRSGQQVYAAGTDLIVLAPVSQGAEILADGNIHVYGPLRGRALAGVSGDTNARIFCHSLEAELISIGGVFKLSEDLQNDVWKQPVQAYLDEGHLHVRKL